METRSQSNRRHLRLRKQLHRSLQSARLGEQIARKEAGALHARLVEIERDLREARLGIRVRLDRPLWEGGILRLTTDINQGALNRDPQEVIDGTVRRVVEEFKAVLGGEHVKPMSLQLGGEPVPLTWEPVSPAIINEIMKRHD